MKKGVKIPLLGLMIWFIPFIVVGISFAIFDIHDEAVRELMLVSAVKSLFLTLGLALALYVVYRDKGQDYKRTAWTAGITWYAILVLLDLVVLIVLLGLDFELWLPSIFSYSMVAIIPVIVGYLLAGPRSNS